MIIARANIVLQRWNSRVGHKLPSTTTLRCYGNLFQEELTVQTFSNVHVDIPFHVKIKPLDVHQYHNCDKLKIRAPVAASIKHYHDGSNIRIYSERKDFDNELWCSIKAPIKANIDVKSQGKINVGYFNGDKLELTTTNGDITVDKYLGDTVKLFTVNGDIRLKGLVQAADIEAKISGNGSIATDRLQGLRLNLQTTQGNIETESSYCDVSRFQTNSGFLQLKNVHKTCFINIIESGDLDLIGLDGKLEANLNNSCADIQLMRILDHSNIVIKDNGKLILKLSDDCQRNVLFEILSQQTTIDHHIKPISKQVNDITFLTPTAQYPKKVTVTCKNSSVDIQTCSWKEMFKLSMNK